MKEFVSRELSGSVSTPKLGSVPTPNYYEERHEYTAVIELPHNISEVIGDGALEITVAIVTDEKKEDDFEVTNADPSLGVTTTEVKLEEDSCWSEQQYIISNTHSRLALPFSSLPGVYRC